MNNKQSLQSILWTINRILILTLLGTCFNTCDTRNHTLNQLLKKRERERIKNVASLTNGSTYLKTHFFRLQKSKLCVKYIVKQSRVIYFFQRKWATNTRRTFFSSSTCVVLVVVNLRFHKIILQNDQTAHIYRAKIEHVVIGEFVEIVNETFHNLHVQNIFQNIHILTNVSISMTFAFRLQRWRAIKASKKNKFVGSFNGNRSFGLLQIHHVW